MTADAARNQNVHADRDADEGVDDEIDERGRRADSGKGDTAREFADNDDVRCVKQQLEHAGRGQRERELQDAG